MPSFYFAPRYPRPVGLTFAPAELFMTCKVEIQSEWKDVISVAWNQFLSGIFDSHTEVPIVVEFCSIGIRVRNGDGSAVLPESCCA